jgi:hypothetical protein
MMNKDNDLDFVLSKMTAEIDDFIGVLAKKYRVSSPVLLSTVIFARLSRMNIELGTGKEFVDLNRKCLDDMEIFMAQTSDSVH